MAQRKKTQVFVSYSRHDETLVRPLAAMLGAAANDAVFLDVTSIKAGDLWESEIKLALKEASVFILCWCCDSSKSAFVAYEMRKALRDKRKKLVPVLFCDMPLPPSLRDRQWIDLKGRIVHPCNHGDGHRYQGSDVIDKDDGSSWSSEKESHKVPQVAIKKGKRERIIDAIQTVVAILSMVGLAVLAAILLAFVWHALITRSLSGFTIRAPIVLAFLVLIVVVLAAKPVYKWLRRWIEGREAARLASAAKKYFKGLASSSSGYTVSSS